MYLYYKCHKSDLLHYVKKEKMKEDLIGNFKKIMYMKQVTTSRREKHSAQKMEKIARINFCTDCYRVFFSPRRTLWHRGSLSV